MSAVGIFAIAFNSKGERYESFHTPPEVKDYIESVIPPETPHEYQDDFRWFKIDTTENGCLVTAKAKVTVPCTDSTGKPTTEQRNFSFWRIKQGPDDHGFDYPNRQLEIEKGEWGIIIVYYGLLTRPFMHWAKSDIMDFNWWVHIMMMHIPGWQPPEPGGPGPRAQFGQR